MVQGRLEALSLEKKCNASARNNSRPLAISDQFDHLADQNLF